MKRSTKTATVLAVGALVATTLAAGGSATASVGSSRSGGKPVYVIATRTLGERFGPVQFAGGIGDYGKGEYATASGKPDPGGNYYLAVLKHGHVIVNLTQLNKRFESAAPSQYNADTCSGVFKVSATAPIVGGTGAYSGAQGSLHVSARSEFVMPRYASGPKAGQCDTSSQPSHAFTTLSARGKITP